MISKRKTIENIYKISQQQGIKIGDLETAANVSKGYLSRQSNDEIAQYPPVTFFAAVAEKLGLTIDDLVNYDLSKLYPDELKSIQFLNKLIQNVKTDKDRWYVETQGELDIYSSQRGNQGHPISFVSCNDGIFWTGTNDNPDYWVKVYGSVNRMPMSQYGSDGYLLLFHHDNPADEFIPEGKTFSLIWVIPDSQHNDGSVSSIIHVDETEESIFHQKLYELEKTIIDRSSHKFFSSEALSIMDKVIEEYDPTNVDPDNLPF